jgi:anaerobic magnesium-protoporphyrin IX monomethyl ester cyclase
MGKSIIFINPPYERIAPGYSFIKTMTSKVPALGLLHLAAQVRRDGYSPTIIESDVQGLSAAQVAARVIRAKPAYVGITLFTVGVWLAAELSRRIKAVCPDIIILVGGPHISSMGLETMQRFPEFDIAVIGEGETVLSQLLTRLEAAQSPADVPNVIYRQDGRLRSTARQSIRSPMDDLPLPAWDLLPGFPRAYTPAVYSYPRGPVGTIAASRGCPFHCSFCDTSTFGAEVRAYSPQKVFDQMLFLKKRWGVNHVLFVDDLFVASAKRTRELCRLIIENRLKMTWTCSARVDCVKPPLLRLMKQAGCWEIEFGLETGSNELLKKMEKQARVERGEQAVNWTHDAGIRTKGLFMLGYPGENMETIDLTKALVKRLPMHVMNLTKFTPYPGSPIYRDLYGTKMRDDHWERMNGMNFVWAPDGISVEELDRQYQDVIKCFYRRREICREYIRMSAENPMHLWRMLWSGMGFARAKILSYVTGHRGLLTRAQHVRLDPAVKRAPLRLLVLPTGEQAASSGQKNLLPAASCLLPAD